MVKKLDKRGGLSYFGAVGVSIKETGKINEIFLLHCSQMCGLLSDMILTAPDFNSTFKIMAGKHVFPFMISPK